MDFTFSAIADSDGQRWRALFHRLWPAYKRWYLSDGAESRPSYLECRRAMRQYMPGFIPAWERMVDLAGGGDLEARFLSLYCPPAYISGCSQAVWPGAEPMLVRNYDYSTKAFDGVVLKTNWSGRQVMGTSDCLTGLVDGINDAGLSVSLTFGGRKVVGDGFGVPIILRYLLESCETAEQASALLCTIPTHMSYNVTVLDAYRHRATVYLSPDRAPVVTNHAVATNHQEGVEWVSHARQTATIERERFLLSRIVLHEETEQRFISHFLRPPLYSLAFARGFGTLYTAALYPVRRQVSYRWPQGAWLLDLNDFHERDVTISYPDPWQQALA